MDDEKYLTLSQSEMKRNDRLCTDNTENIPDTVKFEDKLFVRCAISDAGFV